MGNWTTERVNKLYRERGALQTILTEAMRDERGDAEPRSIRYRCWELHRLLVPNPKYKSWGKALSDDDAAALQGAGASRWGLPAIRQGLVPKSFTKSTRPIVQVTLIAQRVLEFIAPTQSTWTVDEVVQTYRPIPDLEGVLIRPTTRLEIKCAQLEEALDGRESQGSYRRALRELMTPEQAVGALNEGLVLPKLSWKVVDYARTGF